MGRPFQWVFDRPLVYVDCGARGDSGKRLLKPFTNAHYIGFEPDAAECDRLRRQAPRGYTYHPVAVGACSERRELYLTRNPACSSLLPPDAAMLAPYAQLPEFFEVVGRTAVDVVALDQFLESQHVAGVDVLELDVQGTELDVLHGARGFLERSVLAVMCEVEFVPMYRGQALFGDVDGLLRTCGFSLMDLQRYYVRRHAGATTPTRGQLLWGQAVYLKRHDRIAPDERLEVLGAVAALMDFNDYAAEIVDVLLARQPQAPRLALLKQTRRALESRAQSRLMKRIDGLQRTRLRPAVTAAARTAQRVAEAYAAVTRRQQSVWKD
jgi:FkbM family methyltransferase